MPLKDIQILNNQSYIYRFHNASLFNLILLRQYWLYSTVGIQILGKIRYLNCARIGRIRGKSAPAYLQSLNYTAIREKSCNTYKILIYWYCRRLSVWTYVPSGKTVVSSWLISGIIKVFAMMIFFSFNKEETDTEEPNSEFEMQNHIFKGIDIYMYLLALKVLINNRNIFCVFILHITLTQKHSCSESKRGWTQYWRENSFHWVRQEFKRSKWVEAFMWLHLCRRISRIMYLQWKI